MGTIVVSNLGKAYKQYPNRWSRLIEWLDPWERPRHRLHWVLQEINFTLQPGEAVGIIGINGAGKSTLLKLITGTTQPTTGEVKLHGRVAALLELGLGFHPDFTGRQNVFIAGQLLGIPKEEIERLMPEIEAFAEIGDYIDQPVRVYSSGMQMRLAFSVATAVRPDILIVDEALSVGDAYFQHKSFARIRQYREQGTTLLIVSHDKQAILSLCDRAMLLSGGRIAMEGDPEAVIDYYNAMLANHQEQQIKQVVSETGKVQTISGTGAVTLREALLLNEGGEPIEVVHVGQRVKLKIIADVHQEIPELVIGYLIKDRIGQPVFGTNTLNLKRNMSTVQNGARVEAIFSFSANLGPGSYSITIAFHSPDGHVAHNYEWRDHALLFNVVNIDKEQFIGAAWLPPTVERIDEHQLL